MMFAAFAGMTFVAALSGGVFKPGDWYEGLRKPRWTPAKWVFPTVWTLLYIMIAIAGWLVWRGPENGVALAFWGAQVAFNALWSALFFGLRRMDLAMVDVVLLWCSIVGFIVTAAATSHWAAALFAPYLAWVTAAGLLNWQMIRLNLDPA